MGLISLPLYILCSAPRIFIVQVYTAFFLRGRIRAQGGGEKGKWGGGNGLALGKERKFGVVGGGWRSDGVWIGRYKLQGPGGGGMAGEGGLRIMIQAFYWCLEDLNLNENLTLQFLKFLIR